MKTGQLWQMFVRYRLIKKWIAVLTIKLNVYISLPFMLTIVGHVVGLSIWSLIPIAKKINRSRNVFFENWRKIESPLDVHKGFWFTTSTKVSTIPCRMRLCRILLGRTDATLCRWTQNMNLHSSLTAVWGWSKKWYLLINPAKCNCSHSSPGIVFFPMGLAPPSLYPN